MAKHLDVTPGRIKQPQQHLHGRRFARPVRSEQTKYLAAPNLEIHVVHRLRLRTAPEVLEDFRQAAYGDDIFREWRVAGGGWGVVSRGHTSKDAGIDRDVQRFSP